MLFRNTGKAKSACIFICDNLYEKAHNYLYMRIELPDENAKIVRLAGFIFPITAFLFIALFSCVPRLK